MQIKCSVLGKDLQITDSTIPVISPYWRLKRNGDWSLLCRYEHEQINYSILPTLVGATLSLMDGRLTFRHLAMVVQYTHDFETLEKARQFVTSVIVAANKDSDAIVSMTDEIAPYLKKINPMDFVRVPEHDVQQKRPSVPVSLNLMFSNDCETNCVYCYADRRIIPVDRQLSMERWKEILQEARTLGMEQVTLSGGDPLSRKDAVSLIAELIKLEMLFLLSTKCHITEEIANSLVEIGMTKPINQYTREIQLSMDGPDEETADRLAGSNGYYKRAVESIANLVKRGFNLRVKAVVTPLNTPRVYQWIKQLSEMGVRQISVAAYNRTFHRHDDSFFLSQEDRTLIAEQCEQARNDFPGIELRMTGLEKSPRHDQPVSPVADSNNIAAGPGQSRSDKAERWKDRAQCSGGRSSLTITPDGKVILCDTVPQEDTFIVGDLSHQSIMDVWHSEALLDFVYPARERFEGSACYDCTDMAECQNKAGYCFRDTYFNYGTVFGPPPKCPLAQDDGMRME